MKLSLDPVRAQRIPLTPLVDVIFLLLLFFMLSSTFVRYGQVQFVHGSAGGTSMQKPDVLIVVTGDGMRINGRPENTYAEAIASLAGLEQAGATTAIIQVDDRARSQDLILFLDAARTQSGLVFTVVP